MAPICENPNTAKNSRIMEIPNLDTTELFVNKSSESAGTQMRQQFPEKIVSITQTRVVQNPPEIVAAKKTNEYK